MSEGEARRAFLKNCGKMSLAASPAMTLLLSGTSASAQVGACSAGTFSFFFGLCQGQCCGTTLFFTCILGISGSTPDSGLCASGFSAQSLDPATEAEILRQFESQGVSPEDIPSLLESGAGESGGGGGAAGEAPPE